MAKEGEFQRKKTKSRYNKQKKEEMAKEWSRRLHGWKTWKWKVKDIKETWGNSTWEIFYLLSWEEVAIYKREKAIMKIRYLQLDVSMELVVLVVKKVVLHKTGKLYGKFEISGLCKLWSSYTNELQESHYFFLTHLSFQLLQLCKKAVDINRFLCLKQLKDYKVKISIHISYSKKEKGKKPYLRSR